MPETSVRTGVDLGGTKIEAVVLDHDGGILARRRCETPKGAYEATVEATAALVARVEEEARVSAGHVGVGAPGSISRRTGLHRNANSTVLNGRPLRADLAAAIGREVRIANDADCLALSEALDGAGSGYRCVFAVILGTGVGGGLVFDGVLHEGPNGLGGEFGHTALPRPRPDEVPGPECWCGRRGCLEGWLSGTAIEAAWASAGHPPMSATALADAASGHPSTTDTCPDVGHPPNSVPDHERPDSGRQSQPSRALDMPSEARDLINDWLDRLARALANATTLLDPDVIVFGGGLSSIRALYTDLPKRLNTLVFADTCVTPIVEAEHSDSSGVLGAARL